MNRSVIKKHLFYTSNIFFSLLLGLIVYLFFRPDTYISQALYSILGFTIENRTLYLLLPKWTLAFIRNFLSDMLWAYALTFTVCFIWWDIKKPIIHTVAISVLFEILIEILQKFGVITGTFDWMDILLEICISAFAALLIKNFCARRKENEESC